MIDQNLANYIEDCRKNGQSDDQIKGSLIAAGWSEEQIAEAFPQKLPVEDLLHPVQKNKKTGKIIGLSLLVLLLIFSGSVALAEKGYLTAFSKIYRKTNLPLLWKGTTADPATTLAKTFEIVADDGKISSDSSINVTLSVNDAKKQVNAGKSKIFADFQNVQTSDISQTSSEPSVNDYLGMFLPASFGLKSTILVDNKNENIQGRLELDLGTLYSKFSPFITPSLSTFKQNNSFEGIFLSSEKSVYFKSSLIPYSTPSDAEKWLKFADVYNVDTAKIKAEAKKSNQDLVKQLGDMAELLRNTIKDDGIIRKDGQAYAEYSLNMNNESFKTLLSSSKLTTYKEYLTALTAQNISISAKIYLDPANGRLVMAEGKMTSVEESSNIKIVEDFKATANYNPVQNVGAPSGDKTITEPGDKYLEGVFSKLIPATTSISTDSLNVPSEPAISTDGSSSL